jgi:hypothetical protein
MKLTNLALVAALIVFPAALFAQSTVSSVPVPATSPAPALPPSQATGKTIANRKVDQQDRIASGVKSGQLTAGETAHLEGQESAINKEERAMRAQDNGKLTHSDKKTLDKQQNAESRRIYRDKHNTRVRAAR